MRAMVIVIDAFGIGALPDAALYGDEGANTLGSISRTVQPLEWPNLIKMGLGNAAALLDGPLAGCAPVTAPLASFGAMQEKSKGKDTTTGHWEIGGIVLDRAFHVFPPAYPSFPADLVRRFEQESGYRILGNKSASGTVIIQELGEQQMAGGQVIAYTSADSVFQIAAHESVMPLEELYRVCKIARKLCDDYDVARVIARPFVGEPGNFTRSAGRHDYSIDLPGPSVLDHLVQNGVDTVGVGKIGDIFNQQGIARSYPDKGNDACLERVGRLLTDNTTGDRFIFVNLVETDMLYGHRRDIRGYHDAVRRIDEQLPDIIKLMNSDDLLVLTADHGCDPGFPGSDHTREYVPLLVYRPGVKGRSLGVRDSFGDVARSLSAFFGISPFGGGRNFIDS
ncbi:MAG: phosphopentomutase [Desulfobacteraceae bacterium]|nr:phosphopentomutase [Desulfobacteraceae bacterium]